MTMVLNGGYKSRVRMLSQGLGCSTGGSSISGKEVQTYKGGGGGVGLLTLSHFFLYIP